MSPTAKKVILSSISLALILGYGNAMAGQFELAQYGNGPYMPGPYMLGPYSSSPKGGKPDKVDRYNNCMDKCNTLKMNCEMSIPSPRATEIDGILRVDINGYEEKKHAKCDPKVEACTDRCDKIME